MKELKSKELLQSMLEINRDEKRLIILVKMNEPTRERVLEVYHPSDIDKILKMIDEEYDKNLRGRINYDNLIEAGYLTEDEDLRYMLNGEQPYQMNI